MIRAWLPVAAGLAGALFGGWLAGRLLGLGLVLIAESGLAVTWGLFRDDGTGAHRVPRAGERTLAEVLDYQRRVQLSPGRAAAVGFGSPGTGFAPCLIRLLGFALAARPIPPGNAVSGFPWPPPGGRVRHLRGPCPGPCTDHEPSPGGGAVRFIDRLLSRDQGYNEAMFSGAVLVTSDDPGGRGREPPPSGFAATVRRVYKSSGPVYAAMFARMSLLSQAEFKFQRRADQTLYGTPDLRLLEQPWPNGTSSDLLARMEQHRGIAGSAYVRKVADDELVLMRPDTVTIISEEMRDTLGRLWKRPVGYSEDLGPLGYQGRAPQIYETAEVAHWAPDPDPDAAWRGMSWLTPVIREVTGDQGMTEYKIAHISNGAMPGVILKYSQRLSDQAVENLKKRMAAKFGGPENAGKTLVLDEGADLLVAGSSLEQLQYTTVQGAGVARILAAASVPAEVCGLTAGGTTSESAGYETAMRRFADLWARTSWRSACSALEVLVPHSADNPGVRLWYDVSGIAALREGELARAQGTLVRSQALAAFVNAGFTRESSIAAAESGDLAQLKPDPNATPPGVAGRETATTSDRITANGQLPAQAGPGVIPGRPPQAGVPQRLPGVGHPNLPNALPGGVGAMPALPNGARGPQAGRSGDDEGDGQEADWWM